MKKRLEPHLDLDLDDMENELWDSVVGYDGYYSVSTLGRVMSESRLTLKNAYTKQRILKQFNGSKGQLLVSLSVDCVVTKHLVSNLVGTRFIREKNKGENYHFKDFNVKNCKIDNLIIILISNLREKSRSLGRLPNLLKANISSQASFLKRRNESIVINNEGIKERTCTKCNSLKDAETFGRYTYCNDCRKAQYKSIYNKKKLSQCHT